MTVNKYCGLPFICLIPACSCLILKLRGTSRDMLMIRICRVQDFTARGAAVAQHLAEMPLKNITF
jgi:hypothetical protein